MMMKGIFFILFIFIFYLKILPYLFLFIINAKWINQRDKFHLFKANFSKRLWGRPIRIPYGKKIFIIVSKNSTWDREDEMGDWFWWMDGLQLLFRLLLEFFCKKFHLLYIMEIFYEQKEQREQ